MGGRFMDGSWTVHGWFMDTSCIRHIVNMGLSDKQEDVKKSVSKRKKMIWYGIWDIWILY
jgi:hypothetical protein